jgi:hypothetical protein
MLFCKNKVKKIEQFLLSLLWSTSTIVQGVIIKYKIYKILTMTERK